MVVHKRGCNEALEKHVEKTVHLRQTEVLLGPAPDHS
jgi:hypothetical protein